MNRLSVAVSALFLAMPSFAEQTVIECPSSVKEGGLIAQAFNCPIPGSEIGHYYCEYRDEPGVNNPSPSNANSGVASSARGRGRIDIYNASGGWYTLTYENVFAYDMGSDVPRSEESVRIPFGEDFSMSFEVSGVPNYAKGSTNGAISIRRRGASGPVVSSCDISVIDDDNSAYIGQRRSHPYGGTWKTTPHCMTEGCAWR